MIRPEHGDDPSIYETEEATDPLDGRLRRMLLHKPNGECIYLNEAGCSIHARRPIMCRAFDCAGMYRKLGRQLARRLIRGGDEVLAAGRRQWLARTENNGDNRR